VFVSHTGERQSGAHEPPILSPEVERQRSHVVHQGDHLFGIGRPEIEGLDVAVAGGVRVDARDTIAGLDVAGVSASLGSSPA
jgi:hypothetical protein